MLAESFSDPESHAGTVYKVTNWQQAGMTKGCSQDLCNALITADPLHNKEATAGVILEKGGDFLIGTKENTSKRLKGAAKALEGSPFLT